MAVINRDYTRLRYAARSRSATDWPAGRPASRSTTRTRADQLARVIHARINISSGFKSADCCRVSASNVVTHTLIAGNDGPLNPGDSVGVQSVGIYIPRISTPSSLCNPLKFVNIHNHSLTAKIWSRASVRSSFAFSCAISIMPKAYKPSLNKFMKVHVKH